MIYSAWCCIQNMHLFHAMHLMSHRKKPGKCHRRTLNCLIILICVWHIWQWQHWQPLSWKILNHPLYSPIWPPAIFTCLNHEGALRRAEIWHRWWMQACCSELAMWLGCVFLCCCHQCLAMVVAKACQCRGIVSRESDNSVNLACMSSFWQRLKYNCAARVSEVLNFKILI